MAAEMDMTTLVRLISILERTHKLKLASNDFDEIARLRVDAHAELAVLRMIASQVEPVKVTKPEDRTNGG